MPAPSASAALPLGEKLVPAATKFFFTCRSVKDFEAVVGKTLLGQMFKDEQLKPFFEDLEAQIDKQIETSDSQFGIKVKDLENLCDGQITVAIVPLKPDEAGKPRTGTVLFLDVTGHADTVTKLQQKIASELTKRQAQGTPYQAPTGAVGTAYAIPPQREGGRTAHLVDAVQTVGPDQVWLLGNNADIVGVISAMLSGAAVQPLESLPAFEKLMDQTAPTANESPTSFAWFADPLGMSEALRAYEHPPLKHKPDGLAVLRNVGFNALQGFGGQASVASGDYGLLVRLAGLAPQPWQKSMNMLTFLPGADFAPQGWIAADSAGYASIYWDILKAFDHFGPLFDGFLEDEGIWADVVKSMEEDPDGPQVKLRNDFFALLGTRVTALVDCQRPAQADSSRYLMAFEIKNPQDMDKLATTMKKAFANDPAVEQMKLGNLDVYKIIAEEEVPANAPGAAGAPGGKRLIVSALVTAANGHVFIASHVDILQKVLGPPPTATLATAPDYVAVTGELGKFLPPNAADLGGIGFVRVADVASVDYELFRTGKLPGAQTILGRVLDLTLLKKGDPGPRPMKLDGSKLPPFEQIRKYLPPIGILARVTPDGWLLVGITHDKVPVPAQAAAAAAPVK